MGTFGGLFRLSAPRLSNPMAHNQRRLIRGFYRPFQGASKMKWFMVRKYERLTSSLYHYPEVSRVTGKKIDWMYGTPKSGFEALKIFGPHTLELEGMPMGRTPEYMQERLRRFFSKFGTVVVCRAQPHPLDPYQCEGTAWVAFRDRDSCLKALKAPLKFPASLHDKVVKIKYLAEDKTNDPSYLLKAEHWNGQLVDVARQLHETLSQERGNGMRTLEDVHLGLTEKEYRTGAIQCADFSVFRRFGSWKRFLDFEPMKKLFIIQDLGSMDLSAEDRDRIQSISLKPNRKENIYLIRASWLSKGDVEKALVKLRVGLENKLQEEISVHWRDGKPQLPAYTERQVRLWDHKDKLPFDLQILSRTRLLYRIFDERFLYKARLKRARAHKRWEFRQEKKEARAKKLEQLKEQAYLA